MRYIKLEDFSFICINLILSKIFLKFDFFFLGFFLNLFWCYKIIYNFIFFKFIYFKKFKQFFFYFNQIFRRLNFISFFDLRLEGLGFGVFKFRRKKRDIYKINLGYSTYKLFIRKKLIFFKFFEEKVCLLCSIYPTILSNYIVHLLNFRLVKPYRLIGMADRKQFYILRLVKLENLDKIFVYLLYNRILSKEHSLRVK